MKTSNISLLFVVVFLQISLFADSQPNDLVEITAINPTIHVELRYATDNNFTGQAIYDCPLDKCFVLSCVAEKLDSVQRELKKQGLGLKIWDGLRTFAAQERFWEICPDERYVANPKKGGRHTRGTTVDLTLIYLVNGTELVMPTEFDSFTVQAHRDCMDLSQEVIKNRQLLEDIMHKHGFKGLATEWWHFDLVGWQEFPPLKQINFNDLIVVE